MRNLDRLPMTRNVDDWRYPSGTRTERYTAMNPVTVSQKDGHWPDLYTDPRVLARLRRIKNALQEEQRRSAWRNALMP